MVTEYAGLPAPAKPAVALTFTVNWRPVGSGRELLLDVARRRVACRVCARFDGVERVWLIEVDGEGVEDTWGLGELESLGFAETGRRIETHRSAIIELTR